MAEGLTTIEIKSGYGLDVANERKTLRVARALGREGGVTVKATCLAAHALPPEFAGKPDDYIDLVCNEILPAVAADGLGRRRRCLLRTHRLHRRADGAGVRQGQVRSACR